MKGEIRNFFPSCNTSYGFYSFYQHIINIESARRNFYIKGGPGTDKSSLMRNVGEFFNNKGYDIEYHHCSSDNNSLDAVVIKGLNISILDDTSPHAVDFQNPGAVDEILNIGEFDNEESFKKYRENIINTNKEIHDTFQRAYKYMAAAKLINDNWSNYNEKSLDASRLFLLNEDLKNKILPQKPLSRIGKERHIFATAFTQNGIITFIENLCENCKKTYVLNGGPGTGKTKILKYVYTEALNRGLFVEVYHNPLLPEKIEHIIIPELKTAILTSNEINNKHFNGIQIYMENLIDYSLINKDELHADKDTFYSLLNKGLSIISSTKQLHDKLESYYIENMNFKQTDKAYDDLLVKLLKYEKDYLLEQGL